MKSVAILQSNYIPWKGYFDLISSVDEFIVYDDVQYTRRDWRNRNKIKTPKGLLWLSIPIEVKGKYFQRINQALVSDPFWAKKHWETIKQYYSKAIFFNSYRQIFEEFYLSNQDCYLTRINFRLIKIICGLLEIQTKISSSSDYILSGGRTERILGLCEQAKAQMYVSGPAAKAYFDESLADERGIRVSWFNYSGYPEYRQLHPPFEHHVSVIDLIFNEGPSAYKFIRSSPND